MDPTAMGNEALRLASARGHTAVVELLLHQRRHRQVDPGSREGEPICRAARYGHVDIVRLLLNQTRSDPGARDNEALRMAARYGHDGCVSALLEDGRVDATTNDFDALRVACQNNHVEIARMIATHLRRRGQMSWLLRAETGDCTQAVSLLSACDLFTYNLVT